MLSLSRSGGYNPLDSIQTINNDDKSKMKTILIVSALLSGMVLSGCSSVMSHTGGKEGTYPGTRASSAMLSDDDTGIGTKSLVILDTLLLPWDLFRRDSSLKSRVEQSEKASLATDSVIPPAPMPAH